MDAREARTKAVIINELGSLDGSLLRVLYHCEGCSIGALLNRIGFLGYTTVDLEEDAYQELSPNSLFRLLYYVDSRPPAFGTLL